MSILGSLTLSQRQNLTMETLQRWAVSTNLIKSMFKSKTPAKLYGVIRQASVVIINIQLLTNT